MTLPLATLLRMFVLFEQLVCEKSVLVIYCVSGLKDQRPRSFKRHKNAMEGGLLIPFLLYIVCSFSIHSFN